MWEVAYHPDAEAERNELPVKERVAIANAVQKLEALGEALPFPHQSAVQGIEGGLLRELRPRAGRSPWRPLYCRIEDTFVILAIAPEAQVDKRRFNKATRTALERYDDIESED